MLFSSTRRLILGIIITVLLLSGLGVLFVFEASVAESFTTFGDPYFLLKQQLIGLVIGLSALCATQLIPSKVWMKSATFLYIATLILLILVFIPGVGLRLNGASRWLSLGGLVLQPVEFFKLGMVLYFAQWMSKHQRFGPFAFLLAIPTVLILAQPDLGSLLLVLTIGTCLYFIAGGNLRGLFVLGAMGIPIIVVAIALAPYRLERIKTFINPELDPLGSSFHIRQITLALGRGGWLGQGIGNSNQKFSYIPEASTDSIFSIVAEEVGFVGSFLIVSLFIILFWQLYQLTKVPTLTSQERLTISGITIWLASQTMLNLSAVVALVPLTGVPLPFFSYGRSSLIMVLLATGIVLRIAREHKV